MFLCVSFACAQNGGQVTGFSRRETVRKCFQPYPVRWGTLTNLLKFMFKTCVPSLHAIGILGSLLNPSPEQSNTPLSSLHREHLFTASLHPTKNRTNSRHIVVGAILFEWSVIHTFRCSSKILLWVDIPVQGIGTVSHRVNKQEQYSGHKHRVT